MIQQLNVNSKNHLKSLTLIQNEKSIGLNHTFKNPYFFDIDKKFNDYITNHNTNPNLCLVKWDFNVVFNDFNPHKKTNFSHNTSFISLKRYLFYWIEYFIGRGCKFFDINEKNIPTIKDKINMTNEQYIKQAMQAVDIRLNVIIAKNPHLLNSPNSYFNHPLIRKYSHIPFTRQ